MKTGIEHVLLLATALMPAVAGALPSVPLPPRTDVVDVARHIVFNGLDMQAQVFRSQQGQADVVAFYRKLWTNKVVVNKLGDAVVVGHRQGDYYVTVQVTAFGGGSKGKLGIVDVASVPKGFVPGKWLPKPMGSRVFNDISYPDDAVPARTVGLRNSLSPRQNATFYRERLAADGWKPADANQCVDDSCVMYYTRGDSKMTLVMSPAEGQSQVIVNVLQP